MAKQLKDKLKYKVKAASIHLLLSLIIFAVILYFILYEWYPEPFFTAQGGWQGIRLMALVDLVLGPTLTLIVYNHLKQRKEIIFDLSLIAAVQCIALVLGGYQVYSQRPIALVFWATEFYTVTDEDYRSQGIESPDFSQYSKNVPPLIYSRPIATQDELDLTTSLTDKRIPVYAQTEFYESVQGNLEAMFHNEVDIREVMLTNSTMLDKLDEITKGKSDSYRYLKLTAKFHNMILVIKNSGELVGSVKVPVRR